VGTPEGCTARSVGKTPHCLAVSYDNKREFALAYIFTRKCPLPRKRLWEAVARDSCQSRPSELTPACSGPRRRHRPGIVAEAHQDGAGFARPSAASATQWAASACSAARAVGRRVPQASNQPRPSTETRAFQHVGAPSYVTPRAWISGRGVMTGPHERRAAYFS
jgi:hypothetical protein